MIKFQNPPARKSIRGVINSLFGAPVLILLVACSSPSKPEIQIHQWTPGQEIWFESPTGNKLRLFENDLYFYANGALVNAVSWY